MPKVLENPRQRILEAARDILIEQGYQEFNIRDVAKATSVSVGTIYNYFPTKSDLIAEIVNQHGEVCLHKISEIGHDVGDIFTKLEKVFLQVQEFIDTFRGIWFKMSEEARYGYADEKMAKHLEFINHLRVLLKQLLRMEAEKDGTICIPVDYTVFVDFLIQNFVAMGQMKYMDFRTLEPILRKMMS